MQTAQQIAKHFKETFFGGNWTAVSLKETLQDITWQQATTKVYNFKTIATLVFHINYYVSGVLEIFKGKPLLIKDEFSFSHPPIDSKEDWDIFLASIFKDAKIVASEIEKLPENIFLKPFTNKKHGNYYRNLHGIIEHTYYHTGQIVLIKKIVQQENSNN